MGLKKVEQ
jgi:hypothetical protein